MDIEKLGAIVPVFGTYVPGMKLADVHIHTRASDGWFCKETLAEAALEAGLSAIVVTDHDEVTSGFDMRDYAVRNNLPLEVYPGSEVTARCAGQDVHVLARGIEDDIPPWQSPEWTVEQIVKQGGIAVLAHPYKKGTGYLRARRELQVEIPVSMEIYNASIADIDRFDPRARRSKIDRNAAATAFQIAHPTLFQGPVGGTDAHFRTVGRGLTAYEGDLLEAIRSSRTSVVHTGGFERLRPSDFVIYASGLRSMKHRRAARWGCGTP